MSSPYLYRGREFRFNDHVVLEMLLGVPDAERTGRVVQVRKGKGSFMSDLLFIRLRDGRLQCFSNVLMRHVTDTEFENAFYRSNGKEPPLVPEQPPFEADGEDCSYEIMGGFPEVGFVIEHPKQPDARRQSFAMTIRTCVTAGCSAPGCGYPDGKACIHCGVVIPRPETSDTKTILAAENRKI